MSDGQIHAITTADTHGWTLELPDGRVLSLCWAEGWHALAFASKVNDRFWHHGFLDRDAWPVDGTFASAEATAREFLSSAFLIEQVA